MACPNDGEPLLTNVNGIIYCPYDGWLPDRQAFDPLPGDE